MHLDIHIKHKDYTVISIGVKIFWPANFHFHRTNLLHSSVVHVPWNNLPIFLTMLIMYSLYKWYLKIRKNYVSIFMSLLDTFTQWTIWMQLSRIHIVVRKFTLNTPEWSFNFFLSKITFSGLPAWHHWTWGQGETSPLSLHKLVQAGSSTPLASVNICALRQKKKYTKASKPCYSQQFLAGLHVVICNFSVQSISKRVICVGTEW